MKRIFVLTALMISISGFSQSFTLNELIKISKYSEDDFDTYVTKKGYIFDEVSEKEYQYTSSIDYTFLVNGLKNCFISKIEDKTKSFNFWVTFQTSESKTYLSIKEELKVYGYKLFDKGTSDGSNFFKYKKGNNLVSLWSISRTNEYTNRTTINYEINFKVINN